MKILRKPTGASIWGPRQQVFYRRVILGRWEVEIDWRSAKNVMGRFGGGWRWKLGVQWSGAVVILSLLILSITVRRRRS